MLSRYLTLNLNKGKGKYCKKQQAIHTYITITLLLMLIALIYWKYKNWRQIWLGTASLLAQFSATINTRVHISGTSKEKHFPKHCCNCLQVKNKYTYLIYIQKKYINVVLCMPQCRQPSSNSQRKNLKDKVALLNIAYDYVMC